MLECLKTFLIYVSGSRSYSSFVKSAGTFSFLSLDKPKRSPPLKPCIHLETNLAQAWKSLFTNMLRINLNPRVIGPGASDPQNVEDLLKQIIPREHKR